MIDPDDLAGWLDFVFVGGAGDEISENVGEIAGAGADVEHTGGGVEEWEERFAGGGVHVWGGDGGFVTDGLRRVFVGGGEVGAVMGAIDLSEMVSLTPASSSEVADQIVPQTLLSAHDHF